VWKVVVMEITEVVLVAIIAASSGFLGAAVAGVITYRVTKRQGDVQLEIHRADLKQQVNEARQNRFVEARKTLLLELRESFGRVWGAHSSFLSTSVAIQRAQAANLGAESINFGKLQQQGYVEATREALQDISRLMPQISDATLYSQIETYLVILNPAMDPDQLGVDDGDFKAAQTVLNTARQYQLVVNKRIEELLAGDDVT